MQQPILETERLTLRPFGLEDAPAIQQLAGAKEVALTTFAVPHPYEDGVAEQWISTHVEEFAAGKFIHFAIVLREQNVLCGQCRNITLKQEMRR